MLPKRIGIYILHSMSQNYTCTVALYVTSITDDNRSRLSIKNIILISTVTWSKLTHKPDDDTIATCVYKRNHTCRITCTVNVSKLKYFKSDE